MVTGLKYERLTIWETFIMQKFESLENLSPTSFHKGQVWRHKLLGWTKLLHVVGLKLTLADTIPKRASLNEFRNYHSSILVGCGKHRWKDKRVLQRKEMLNVKKVNKIDQKSIFKNKRNKYRSITWSKHPSCLLHSKCFYNLRLQHFHTHIPSSKDWLIETESRICLALIYFD